MFPCGLCELLGEFFLYGDEKSIDFFGNMLYNIGEGDDTDGRSKAEEHQTF